MLVDHWSQPLVEELPSPSQLGDPATRLVQLLAAARSDWHLNAYARKHGQELDALWEAVSPQLSRAEFFSVLATELTPALGQYLLQASVEELRRS